jgi:phosphoribosylanthranilate isomerase
MRCYPQIKICGLTIPEEAAACAALGAHAIGLVFYPPSPRHVTIEQAAAITAALPSHVCAVGVFVDPEWEMLGRAITQGRLGAVQLHGNEPQELIDRVREHFGVTVIKSLFAARAPRVDDAARYAVPAFLVECGRGALPGGNALAWDWGAAADFARMYPTVLAGGLAPDNVAEAIIAVRPAAVDASSGLETCPGRKDSVQVERFITAVRRTENHYTESGIRMKNIFERTGTKPSITKGEPECPNSL